MKQILQLFAIVLLTYCSSPEQSKNQQENNDSAILEHETEEPTKSDDVSRYLIEVERINKLVAEIEGQDLIKSEYFFYDEQGTKWELWAYRDKINYLFAVNLSLGFESQEFTDYYLENDYVSCIINTEMRLDYFTDNHLDYYYLDKGGLFYSVYKHLYKDEFIKDISSQISEFNKDDIAFPIILNRESLENVVSNSISSDLHVTQEDFILTHEFKMTQGTLVPEMLDQIEDAEIARFLDNPDVKTSFDESTNVSTVNLTYEDYELYEENFEGKVHFSGIIDSYKLSENPDILSYVLLEISDGQNSYELTILNLNTSKITYRKSVRGQAYKNGKLFVIREVQNDEIEGIAFKGDCSEFESQGVDYKRYGVFEVDLISNEETFTNQVFCQ